MLCKKYRKHKPNGNRKIWKQKKMILIELAWLDKTYKSYKYKIKNK